MAGTGIDLEPPAKIPFMPRGVPKIPKCRAPPTDSLPHHGPEPPVQTADRRSI